MELTRKNYFSHEAESMYMGSSSFKAWDMQQGGCEAREVAKLLGKYISPENSAMLLGSYVHAWNSNELQDFIMENPSLFKKDGTLYAKYALGDTMINTLKEDPLVEEIRQGDKEKILTGEISGVKFKIQVDILNLQKGYFADLKTTKNLNETYWLDDVRVKGTFIDKYNYYQQFAIYSEILRQNLGINDYLDPYIIAVDKQDIPDHEIIYMGKEFILLKLEYISNALPHIMDVKEGRVQPLNCGKCEYCRSQKKLKRPISLEEYAYNLNL